MYYKNITLDLNVQHSVNKEQLLTGKNEYIKRMKTKVKGTEKPVSRWMKRMESIVDIQVCRLQEIHYAFD